MKTPVFNNAGADEIAPVLRREGSETWREAAERIAREATGSELAVMATVYAHDRFARARIATCGFPSAETSETADGVCWCLALLEAGVSITLPGTIEATVIHGVINV